MISGEWFDAKISFYRINISIIAGNTQYNNEDVGNLEVENILNIISLQKNAFIYTAVGKILKLPNEESRGVLFFASDLSSELLCLYKVNIIIISCL